MGELWGTEEASLGLELDESSSLAGEQAVRVKQVTHSSAWVRGKIRPRMLLQSLNGQEVSGQSLECLIETIQALGRPLCGTFVLEDCTACVDRTGKSEAQLVVDGYQLQVGCSCSVPGGVGERC